MKLSNYITCMLSIILIIAGCQSGQPEPTVEETFEPLAKGEPFQPEKTDALTAKDQTPAQIEAAIDPEKGAPKIVLTKAVHDFSEIGPGSTQVADFEFVNEGNTTLFVKRIQSTCGCFGPALIKNGKRYDAKTEFNPPIPFEPGESGKAEVSYKSGATKGPVSKNLYILTNDPAVPRAQLEVKSKIVVNVTVTPEKVDLLLDQDNAGMPDLLVKSLDGVPFSLKSVTVANRTIEVPFDSTAEATEFTLNPKVDTQKLNQFNSGVIQIATNHPQGGNLQVLYNAMPVYEVLNPRYILQDVEPGKPILRDNLIRSNYGNIAEIVSSTSRNGHMEVQEQQQDGAHINLKIKITPPDPESTSRRYITDELTLILNDGHELSIRCSGWFRLK